MNRILCILLLIALLLVSLSGCTTKTAQSDPSSGSAFDDAQQAASSGLAQALENESARDETKSVTLEELMSDIETDEAPEDAANDAESEFGDQASEPAEPVEQEIALDAPLASPEPSPTTASDPDDVVSGDVEFSIGDASSANQAPLPFATPTPQPNAIITAYSDCTGTGLGFKFRYPTGWTNIPGRSTICYVQPLDNGTAYPARVAVTMKKLAHRCTDELCKNELVDYLKTMRTQYDQSTFEVDTELNLTQKFMSNRAMSTTYLAYDGKQEVAGYVIMTYFERYVFVFHFLCAYEDYAAFQPAINTMRDSVAADG